MNKSRPTSLFLAALGLAAVLPVQAGELTQNFVNPDFGGNPINGSYLLSNASAQNNYSAPVKTTTPTPGTTTGAANATPNTAQQFAAQVDRLVMSALASRLVNQAFGAGAGTGPENQTINTGINTISVEATDSGTTVTVVDNASGGRSVISIPNF